MVLHKISQKGDICTVSLHFCDSVIQVGYVAKVRRECVDDQIPYGKVEQATNVILVIANLCYGIVIDFTHDVDAGSRFERREKLLVLFKTSIKPNAVNAVELGNIRDPSLPFVQNKSCVDCQIGKRDILVTRPTIYRVVVILVIVDLTVWVIIT